MNVYKINDEKCCAPLLDVFCGETSSTKFLRSCLLCETYIAHNPTANSYSVVYLFQGQGSRFHRRQPTPSTLPLPGACHPHRSPRVPSLQSPRSASCSQTCSTQPREYDSDVALVWLVVDYIQYVCTKICDEKCCAPLLDSICGETSSTKFLRSCVFCKLPFGDLYEPATYIGCLTCSGYTLCPLLSVIS